MYTVTITWSKYLKTPNSKSFHFNISTWNSQPGVFLVYSNSSDFLSQHNVLKSDRNLHVNLPCAPQFLYVMMRHVSQNSNSSLASQAAQLPVEEEGGWWPDGDAVWLDLSLTPPKHCYSYTYVLATCQNCRWISEDILEGLSPAPL